MFLNSNLVIYLNVINKLQFHYIVKFVNDIKTYQ